MLHTKIIIKEVFVAFKLVHLCVIIQKVRLLSYLFLKWPINLNKNFGENSSELFVISPIPFLHFSCTVEGKYSCDFCNSDPSKFKLNFNLQKYEG